MNATRFAGIALLLLPSHGATLAQTQPTKNVFRAGGFYSHPTGDLETGFGPLDIHLEAEQAAGLTLSYERKIGRIAGVDFNLSRVNYDLKADIEVTGDFVVTGIPSISGTVPRERQMIFLTTSLAFHPLGPRKVDWYFGPGISWLYFPVNETVEEGVHLENDRDYTELALSTRTGADIGFRGGRVALNLDVQYLRASAGADERGNRLHIDPWNLGARIAIRY